MESVETSSYKDQFYPRDIISCALKGREDFPSPSVYAPKLPSVSVSPSAEIVEGSSVTLTCSSDANPAAKYTWYKENQTLIQGPETFIISPLSALRTAGSTTARLRMSMARSTPHLYP
ncbi:sialoadhesin-like [Micropterus salmoides]|uniref:sialoadhesin-like n=1 Tax=Micropterus salmoides TaxID=27706 RepID=UPI0018ED601C|nr:sialoadhesin-like [Micropterus salmoides]